MANQAVSRLWFSLLTEYRDAVAVLYHVAALVAVAAPEGDADLVDHVRPVPYELLITLSQGRSAAALRQGATCPRPTCASD